MKRDVLYNILLEFCIPKKLVRLIQMSSNETYSKVYVSKHLSDTFPIQNDLIAIAFQFSLRICHQESLRK
jgi:hypothetical protein